MVQNKRRGDALKWENIRENVVKDLSFAPTIKQLEEAVQILQKFIEQPIEGNNMNKGKEKVHIGLTSTCNKIIFHENPKVTQLKMENETFPGKIFRWRRGHLNFFKQIKYVCKAFKQEKGETKEKLKSPPQYNETKEG